MIYTFDRKSGKFDTVSSNNPVETGRFYFDYIGNPNGDLKDRLNGINKELCKADYSKWFHGPYLFIIFDKDKKKMYLSAHMFGSPVPVYYAVNGSEVTVTTALNDIKKQIGMKYVLNEERIPDYLMNGYIKGNETLVKNVYKLPQGKGLYASKFFCLLWDAKMEFTGEYSNEKDLHVRYEKALQASIENNIPVLPEGKNYSMALSGGFDSNSILHFIKKNHPDKQVDAVSIGGVKGRDESIVAGEIAALYEGVNFNSTLVSPDTFTHLEEIVERLEGNSFEIGVFLQYELSKYLSSNGFTHLICGECADQVFHKNTYTKTSKKIKKFSYENTPLEMAAYTVLKKSSYMLESFGIKGYYPFLDYEMIAFGHDTRELNGCTKEFHKAECKRLFMDEIGPKLVKQGGTTQMMALFDADFDPVSEAKKIRFYDEKYIPYEFGEGETEKVYYAWLKYLEIFENMYCDR